MQIPHQWKRSIARLVRWPIVTQLMISAIRIVVPRHRVGVAVVVMDAEDRVLMLKHVFHPKIPWGLPGGWLGRNETPQACALRELKEETGLTARLGPVLHVRHDPALKSINLAFLAEAPSGSLKLSSEILSSNWFAPSALPSPILPFTRDAIETAIARQAREIQLQEDIVP